MRLVALAASSRATGSASALSGGPITGSKTKLLCDDYSMNAWAPTFKSRGSVEPNFTSGDSAFCS